MKPEALVSISVAVMFAGIFLSALGAFGTYYFRGRTEMAHRPPPPGDILAIVPGNTAKKPFVFEADKDYPGVVLRIHDYNGFGGNPGSAEYNLKVLPPAR